ncbi:MAG TPA: bifunctional 2-C-methyl-D-erythritol 4-phosphate cytidylyltransferase/2-C-methyl-D-erythritol 2,4-cyclodiphosphate synthase [Firmicutes bacterium]|nr:bifunctional 2-C-methyl-D-erythritol 4-phosphate cytidylyltransferase/2-C-methyl-D-erythritol 2,4-cyclodiphosphate synthase [Bacillota bacterium]
MDGLNDWQVVAIIPAAGAGRRMQGESKQGKQKLLLELAGETIFLRSMKALNLPEIEAFFVPLSSAEEGAFRQELEKGLPEREVLFCAGGQERQDSIASALSAVKAWTSWRVPEAQRLVMIHDAARPLVETEAIRRALDVARSCGAACVGVPVKDTIKEVGADGIITATPERSRLWAVQTPQVFTWPVLMAAYTLARVEKITATDDAALVEKTGHPVQMVCGSYRNIKITTPDDLPMAAALLQERETAKELLSETKLRVGQGFDVHRLVSGRRLVLGGVEIPAPVGLEGHSDADVLIHALIDALLGAIGGGDIGELFPDTDPAYKNIDSRRLLERVLAKLTQKGARLVNVDVTVIAQYPKLAPYRPAIRSTVATLLDLPLTDVNIKATTTEGLGFTGRKEGIAVQVVTLVKVRSCGG